MPEAPANDGATRAPNPPTPDGGLGVLLELSRRIACAQRSADVVLAVVESAVPELADCAAIELFEDGAPAAERAADGDANTVACALMPRDAPESSGERSHELTIEVARALRTAHQARLGASRALAFTGDELLAMPGVAELARGIGSTSALAVPVRAHDQVVGLLTLLRRGSRAAFGPTDVEVAAAVAIRAALAIAAERAQRQERRARERAERTAMLFEALRRTAVDMAAATSTREVVRALGLHARTMLGAESALFAMPSSRPGWLQIFATGDGSDEVPGMGMTLDPEVPMPITIAYRESRAVYCGSREALLAAWPESPPFLRGARAALAAAPLRWGERTLGALALWFGEERAFDEDDRALVETLASQAAVVLERVWLYERSQRTAQQQTLLAQASEVLGSSLEPEAALARVAELVVPTLADGAAVFLFEPTDAARCVVAHYRDPAKRELANEIARRWPLRRDDFGDLAARGDALLYAEVDDQSAALHARDGEHLAAIRALGLRSCIVAPLRMRGAVCGALAFVWADSTRYYDESDLEIARDLAQRASTALEHAALYAEIRAAEETHRLATEAVRGLVYEWDLATGRVVLSPGVRDVVGYDVSEIPDHIEWWIGRVHGDDLQVNDARWQQLDADQAPVSDIQYRVLHRDGTWRHVWDRACVLRGPDGRVVRLVGCAIDVTDRVRAQEALEHADRRKTEFLALLGHELRNPLAAVRSAAQVIEVIGSPDPTLARANEIIVRQVGHMARLLDDLLDLSRIARGKLSLRLEPLDLREVVRQCVDDHRSEVERAGAELALQLPAQRVTTSGDATRIAQVLGNLLHNATKFTPRGGHIEVSLGADAERAEVRVRDDGIGIEPRAMERIFEPFEQDERSTDRSLGGLGLGLALVRGLVELHGGRVRAESGGSGRGATFVVTFPVRAAEDVAPAESIGPSAVRRRVLVVEDNEDAAEMLRVLLEHQGHSVEVAHDGPEALARARAVRPEVVLCDIGLPGPLSGYDVARALREDPATHDARLVALTGYGQDSDQRRAIDAGFDRHVTKPVDPRTLDQLVAP